MFTRIVAVTQFLVLCAVAAASASCESLLGKASTGASAAEELAGLCTTFQESYVPPRGGGSEHPAKTQVVLRQLGLPSAAGRVAAARRILEHSECYESGILLGAIAVTSRAGDPRPLRHLEEITTQLGYREDCRDEDDEDEEDGEDHDDREEHADRRDPDHDDADDGDQDDAEEIEDEGEEHEEDEQENEEEDDPPERIRYSLLVRLAAAAAIGRVIERPLAPSGEDADPVEPERVEEARNALSFVAVCAQEPSDLRTAATESLGILRQQSTRPILELVAADPGDPNTTTAAIIRLAAERSLTTTLINNHSAHSPTANELADLLEQSREGSAP